MYAILFGFWGSAYGSTVNLSNSDGSSSHPHTAVVSAATGSTDNVYAAWIDFNTLSGNNELLFARSGDAGATFDNPIALGNASIFNVDIAKPQIASYSSSGDGDFVFVAWAGPSSPESNDQILFAKSSDGGMSFASPQVLSTDIDEFALNPQIVAIANDTSVTIYVVWQETISGGGNRDILFARSVNIGDTFEPVINLSNDTGDSSRPQIAASRPDSLDTDFVFVSWIDSEGSDRVLFSRSQDSGASFAEPYVLGDAQSGTSPLVGAFAITDATSNVYTAWVDSTEGDNDLMFARSVDNGTTFSTAQSIDTDAGFISNPRMVISENNRLYLIMQGNGGFEDGSFGLFITKSEDEGATFATPISLGKIIDNSFPHLAVATPSSSNIDHLYITWQTDLVASGLSQIFSAVSSDGGDTFSCPQNVADTSGAATTPALAAIADSASSGSDLTSFVWSDDSTGNTEILVVVNPDFETNGISIESIDNLSPRWGIDEVTVSGGIVNLPGISSGSGPNPDFQVTIEWGDGSQSTTGVEVEGCSWGPVTHAFAQPVLGDVTVNVTAFLIDSVSTDVEATSEPVQVTLTPHFPDLSVSPIPSVKQGSNITISGTLIDVEDPDTPGIPNATITIDGSGIEGSVGEGGTIESVTDGDGTFSAFISTTNVTADGWLVQAHYGGDDSYFSVDSLEVRYNTAPLDSVEYSVTESGENIHVDLNGFNASMEFDFLESGGTLFVSECTAPESTRYVAIENSCLDISPGLVMVSGTAAHIAMSLPEVDVDSLDIFAVDLSAAGEITSVVDITESRDVESNTVSGSVTSFSKFVVAIPIHPESSIPEGNVSLTNQLFVGQNEVSFRDIEITSNANASISLDNRGYVSGQTKTLSITDADANIDPLAVDSISAEVSSERSGNSGITVSLVEVGGTSTGEFRGSFIVSKTLPTGGNVLEAGSGDDIFVSYESQSGLGLGRFRATVDGVQESGLVEISDFLIDGDDAKINNGFAPVTNAVNMTLLDASLSPSGSITVTMSYANALLGGDPALFNPEFLQMYYKPPDSGWEVITTIEDVDFHNDTAKTITSAQPVFSPGLFLLAFDTGGPGGAGGGISKPGSGLVLDFVASLRGQVTGGGSGGASGPSLVGDISPGNNVQQTFTLGSDEDEIKVTFETVQSSGTVTIREQTLSNLPAGTIETSQDRGTFYVDGTESETVGKVYDISTSSRYDGSITVTIPYDSSSVRDSDLSESDVRLMHLVNNNRWEDATISVDTRENAVTGLLDSLSPVVAVVVRDGTFGQKYFDVHPLAKVIDVTSDHENKRVVKLLDEEGNETTIASTGGLVTIANTFKNLQRISQQYDYIIEIFDSDDVAIDLMIKSGTLEGGESMSITQAWSVPRVNGDYTIKIFMIHGLESSFPTLLKHAASEQVEVATQVITG